MSDPREPENVVIYIRSCHKYVEEVDYHTRQTTGRPKQFRATYTDGGGYSLQPLAPDKWIDSPTRLEVDTWSVR